jgi:hypothetical protein
LSRLAVLDKLGVGNALELWNNTVQSYPQKAAIVFEDVEWTFEELDLSKHSIV